MQSSERHRVTREQIEKTAEELKNWGKWGPEDELGTLNYTRPEDIVHAASLVRTGKVISLGLNFDEKGPQAGRSKFPPVGRFNPVHTMLRTGTDAYSGVLDARGMRSADDLVIIPSQCATHWDGLAHIFFGDYMWNGYDCRTVSSFGAAKAGIEKTKEKFVGRGVLLDIARHLGLEWLEDGYAITSEVLTECAEAQGVEVGEGDFLLIRTGQMERKLAEGTWDGYNGGDAPGMAFETLYWLQERKVAAIATDTWGAEVRPNESVEGISQPWHWICIPIMGLTMGEIFKLDALGAECAERGLYDFLFVAPALPVTGAVGSPINPLAIL
ncbi:cyclase [Oceanicola sp. 22II-s10i]|uniref:cyclase family protein n=1 Tax=Oceanicola sp. 22II-s10i TaxID=1317116 RepID=UPI000B529336|nr:cyclase family protein [Oceanicola sp. 22II-s10i]OWU81699.1 cyclase [Oceanicola sp. 22II-s10i]